MNEQRPPAGGTGGVASAVIETRDRRPSIVWLIPLIAALVGAFVAYRTLSERGPEVTITFKTAEGLEAGKTQIKYKDVEVGLVESVTLEPDLSGVVCTVRMVKGANNWLTENTQFWIVKPRIAGGQVSGLGTLLSGSYIGMDPALEGKRARSFVGLEVPPVIGMKEPGRYFVLRSNHAGAVDVGAPIYFRQIAVGQVVSSSLDADSDNVTTRVFVRSPYDERVRSNSRFWNASGIDLSLNTSGFRLETESLVSMLIGGIAFDQPTGSAADVANAETVFPLYKNHEDAEQQHFTRTVTWQLDFDQSVRGLNVGAPVEFRGIQIGQVTNVRLYLDEASGAFKIPVLVEIDPERFRGREAPPAENKAFIDRLVATGLRAQLASGSLLTGQLYVSLNVFPDAKPAQIAWNAPIPEFPTVPTPLEEITNNLTKLVERLGKIPVEQIGADLSASLKALRITLQQSEGVAPALKDTLEKTQAVMASANGMIGADSTMNTEMRRALLELSEAARALGLAADQFQAQPSSVIFGKKGSK